MAVLQEDQKGLGMLSLDISNSEDIHSKHLLMKEEEDESIFEPAIKEEPLFCDDPESVEDTKALGGSDAISRRNCSASSGEQTVGPLVLGEVEGSLMNEVQSHVNESRMDLAATLILSSHIRYRTLQEMIRVEETVAEEDTKTFGLILSMKAPKPTAKKLNYHRGGKEVETYHRLLLCRELQEGDVFYILSANANESCHMFREPNTQFVGGFVAIYEGVRDKVIHGIPVVTMKTSLVPIVPNFYNIRVNPIIRDLALDETIQSFLIEVKDPMFSQCGRVPSCRSRFCDSRHSSEVACPALTSGKTTGHAITILFSSPIHNILNCEFTSEALAEVFVAPRALANPNLSMVGLRRTVKDVAAHYLANDVPFIVAGWQKRRRSPGDEASSVRNIHVTFISPKKVMDDAPRFNPAAVVRSRPTATAVATEGVVQHGYKLALEEDVEVAVQEN